MEGESICYLEEDYHFLTLCSRVVYPACETRDASVVTCPDCLKRLPPPDRDPEKIEAWLDA